MQRADGVISNGGFFVNHWLLAAYIDADTRTMLALIFGEFALRVAHLGVFVVPAWVSIRVAALIERERHSFSASREFLLAALVAYLVVLAAATIVPLQQAAVSGAGVISFIPGYTTVGCYARLTGTSVELVNCNMNLLGNIVLFVPLGMLLQLVSPRFASIRAFVAAALVASVTIELIQYLQRFMGIPRSVDIDDVLLNLVGALTGYLLVSRYLKAAVATLPLGAHDALNLDGDGST